MNKKFAAVEDIKKLGRYLKGLLEFSEELEKIGSLEQAAHECEARIEKLKQEEAVAKASASVAIEHNESLFEQAAQKIEEANMKCDQIIAKAQSDADMLVGKAKADAEAMVHGAQAKKAAIELEVQNMRGLKAALEVEIQESQAKVEAFKKELSVMKEKLGV